MLQQLFGSKQPRTLLGICLFAHLLFSPNLRADDSAKLVEPTGVAHDRTHSEEESQPSDRGAVSPGLVQGSLLGTLRQRAGLPLTESPDPSAADQAMRFDASEVSPETENREDELQQRAQEMAIDPAVIAESIEQTEAAVSDTQPQPAPVSVANESTEEARFPTSAFARESSGPDGIDKLWSKAVQLKRRVATYLQDRKKHKERSKAFWSTGEKLRKEFFAPGTEINDTQLVIVNEVMEEYARVRRWKHEQIEFLGQRHWEGEAEDLESMMKALNVETYRQSFIQRIDEKTKKAGSGAARVAEIEEEYELLQNDRPAYIRLVGLFHLKKMIDRKEVGGFVNQNSRTRLMLAMQDEDAGGSYGRAQIVTRIVHNASQLSFVIYPKGSLSADSKHLKLIKARQLYDTEQPTYDRPEGGSERYGMSSVTIGLEDSDDVATDHASLQSIPRPYDISGWDMRQRTRRIRWPTSLPLPLPIGTSVEQWKRDWADWKTATWVPVDIEKAKFGVFVCGAFQFLFMAMLSHHDWSDHPEKYTKWTVWAPALINFAFGATIGMNVGSYLNLKRRGNVTDLLIFNQFISLLCSYTMYALTTPAKLAIWTKHVHIFLNSYINSKARTAWNGWVTIRDQIRYGNDPVEFDGSKAKIRKRTWNLRLWPSEKSAQFDFPKEDWRIPLLNRVHVKMKKLKWSHWFGQAYIDQAPWIPKSIDLVMSLESIGGHELPVHIAELNIPSKLAMILMIPVAHYLIIRDMRRIAQLPEYKDNPNFRFHLAKQEKIWAQRNFVGKLSRRMKASWDALFDEERQEQGEVAASPAETETRMTKVGRKLSAAAAAIFGKTNRAEEEKVAQEQAYLAIQEEEAQRALAKQKRSERVMYEHCEEALLQPAAA